MNRPSRRALILLPLVPALLAAPPAVQQGAWLLLPLALVLGLVVGDLVLRRNDTDP